MHDSGKNKDLTFPFILVVALFLVGGGFFLWQRQQQRNVARRSAVEAELKAMEAQYPAETRQLLAGIRQGKSPAISFEAQISETLITQQRAWNDGDIDQFMESYWKSEDLTFSSGGNITRGWQATLDRYKKKYSSRSKMGTLTFDNLEISPLSYDTAMVLGKWHLQREEDDLGGNFTLVLRKAGNRWVIIHDHTSSKKMED